MKKLLATLVAAMICAGIPVTFAADVKSLYENECAKCHGADGKGNTKMGKKLKVKDYTDAKVQAELKMEKALKVLKEGIKEGDKTIKQPFKDLSDDELKALIEYMKGFGKK